MRPTGAVGRQFMGLKFRPQQRHVARTQLHQPIHSTRSVDFGWENISHINFFLLVDQSLPFCRRTWKGLQLTIPFPAFRLLDPFQRYSRSNSKVVRNSAEFRTFFASKIFGARAPKNLVSYHRRLAAHYVEKFGGVIYTDRKVISQNTSNFWHFGILEFLLKMWGTSVLDIVCRLQAFSFCCMCKNLSGAPPEFRNMVF